MEADDDGRVEVQRLVERGWIEQFESYSEHRRYLGEDPVLSMFCERVVHRHGAIHLIVRECSGFHPRRIRPHGN